MKKFGSIFLVMSLVLSTSSAFAQAKKKAKAKAKAKTSSSKTVEKPTEELPKKEVPSTEVPADLTAAPTPAVPFADPNAQAVTPIPVPTDTPAATPAETRPYPTNLEHLFGLSAAVGLPYPMRFGLNYVHSSRVFSAELGFGSFGLTFDRNTIKMVNTEFGLRWHPFYGSFFVGAMFGSRTVSADRTEIIAGSPVNAKAEVKGNYIAPYFGWMWGGTSSGIFASMDVGYLAPSNPTTTFTTDASPAITGTTDYQTLDSDIRKAGRQVGEQGLPVWTMLRLGYLF